MPIPVSTAPLAYSLDILEYTELAQASSLRGEIAEETLDSGRYGWQAARRVLYLPQLAANTNASRDYDDNDISSPIRTNALDGGLSLSQPFLTGTNLSLGATWRYSRAESLDRTYYNRSRTIPALNTTLTQPLFLFVANPRLRARKRANLSWEDVQDGYSSERLEIAFSARDFYYTLLLKRAAVDVERKKAESATALHGITRSLVQAGKLAKVELGRADIRLKRDLRRVQNAQIESDQALNNFKNFVRLESEAEVELISKLEYRPFPLSQERVLAEAQRHNPTLRSSRRQIESTKITLAETGEGTRPRLNLLGTYEMDRNRYYNSAPRDPFSWSAGVGLSWPLFDATQTRLRVEQGRIGVDNAQRRYETSDRQVQLSLRNAYLDLKRIEEQIRDFGPQMIIARQNVEAVRLQYSNGMARLIDVFDAENEQRDLELEYLNLLVTFNRSRDNLSRLVGIDVERLPQ